ncbi:MAG: hypothetical protein P8Z79_12480, partial [Sedimentisphaerales bacterium]
MIKLSSIGSFFEEHVEKIVLVVVGLVCVWLLITRVIFSPNVVAYNDAKLSPSAVDGEILKEAQTLRQTSRVPPDKAAPYKPRVDEFLAKLDSSIGELDIDSRVIAPREAVSANAVGVYSLPRIGEVNSVDVEHIRAVAYVPINEVTEQNTYDKAGNEPNDVDLVTVEAKYDVAGLYERFKESFVDYVEERWADPCLAKPLFAAVDLQRQELNDDGTWGQWRDVPRARTDPYKRLFQIVENVSQLPAGGLKVRMLQYDFKPVQMGLLQPEAYQFATADEEWFPPDLHKEYKNLKAKEALEEKRQAREEKRDEQLRDTTSQTFNTGPGGRPGGRRQQGAGRPQRGGLRGGGLGGDAIGMGGDYGYGTNTRRGRGGRRSTSTANSRTGRTSTRPGDRGRSTARGSRGRGGRGGTGAYDDSYYDYGMGGSGGLAGQRYDPINEVYDKYYNDVMITRLTQFEKLDALTFWAHDDTVEPRKTYRYRIRLGVFNPVAGTDKLDEKNRQHKNDVILWSDFSEVTKPVKIMGRLYFFANSIREADKAISVEVSKLALGRWHSHDFWVRGGEVIGEPLEPEPEADDRTSRTSRLQQRRIGIGVGAGAPPMDPRYTPVTSRNDRSNVPTIIDYRTGAVMVDALLVNDWSGRGTLQSRNYYDMLYSFDGVNIEHMPIGPSYRPQELVAAASLISK